MNKQFVLNYLNARIGEIKYAFPKKSSEAFVKGQIFEIEKLIELLEKSKKK